MLLNSLRNALLQYTNLDPETSDEKQLIMNYFSQSFLDSKGKPKRLERGPLTLQAETLTVAFKVHHGRDEKACKQDYLMIAKTAHLAKAET